MPGGVWAQDSRSSRHCVTRQLRNPGPVGRAAVVSALPGELAAAPRERRGHRPREYSTGPSAALTTPTMCQGPRVPHLSPLHSDPWRQEPASPSTVDEETDPEGERTYPGPLSREVADVFKGGSSRLSALPCHSPKGPWTLTWSYCPHLQKEGCYPRIWVLYSWGWRGPRDLIKHLFPPTESCLYTVAGSSQSQGMRECESLSSGPQLPKEAPLVPPCGSVIQPDLSSCRT